jgi:pimeloyl-ACP methyl ester carboxylesterase
LEFGQAEAGPPILLLHGIASITALGAPLVPHLAGRRIIMMDWPGHGLSGPVRLTKAIPIREHAVSTLTSVCDALGIESVDIIGHSMGAQFGLYLASDVPTRVRRLVVMGAPGAALEGVRPPAAMKALSVAGLGRALLRMPMPMSAYRKSLDDMLGDEVLDRHPAAFVEIGMLAGRRPGYAASVASFFHGLITPARVRPDVPVTREQLAGLTAPTLFVWGEHDIFLAPDDAAHLTGAMPNSTVITVAGGHAPWLDEPQLCGEAIARFVAWPTESPAN